MGAGFIVSFDPEPAYPVDQTQERPHGTEIFTEKAIIKYRCDYSKNENDKTNGEFIKKVR